MLKLGTIRDRIAELEDEVTASRRIQSSPRTKARSLRWRSFVTRYAPAIYPTSMLRSHQPSPVLPTFSPTTVLRP